MYVITKTRAETKILQVGLLLVIFDFNSTPTCAPLFLTVAPTLRKNFVKKKFSLLKKFFLSRAPLILTVLLSLTPLIQSRAPT